MKIAVMGAGGLGGYYGGMLARAGHDVTFIARSAHLDALRRRGLEVNSVHGDFRVSPVKATDTPADAGTVELVLFTPKTYDTESAAERIKPIVGGDTVVISFQNGVDAAERIGAVLGRDHLLGGATWISAAIESPGVIGQYSQFRRIALGEFDNVISPRLQRVSEVLKDTGAEVEMAEDIMGVLWTKFVFISSVSAMGGLTRVTFGEYRHVPESRALLAEAIGEVASVGRAEGALLDPDIVNRTLSFIDQSGAEMKPSMQRDVEAGRVCELESLIGIVVRRGEAHNVPTPLMRVAYGALKPGLLKAGG